MSYDPTIVCPNCRAAVDIESEINNGMTFTCTECKKKFSIKIEKAEGKLKEKDVQDALGLTKVYYIEKKIPVKTEVHIQATVIANSPAEAIAKFNAASADHITDFGGEVARCDVDDGAGDMYNDLVDKVEKKLGKRPSISDLPGSQPFITPSTEDERTICDLDTFTKATRKSMIQ